MKDRLRISLLLIAALALVAASCSSDGGSPVFGGGDGDGGTEQTTGPFGLPGDGSDTTNPSTAGGDDDGTVFGGGQPDYRPLPIREGLGTFDNYKWRMEMSTLGPTAEETSEIVTEWGFNSDPESSYNLTTTTETGPDFEEPQTTTLEVYTVEGETCQFDGESWTYEEATDQQREVLDVAERLFDFTIVPENPVEVGVEDVAGLPAIHYSYTVSGFGAESGALVTANQVDYWVSQDTNVLLRYEMVVESRSGPEDDPEAEIYRVEASAELASANEPVAVELPAACLEAAAEQEG